MQPNKLTEMPALWGYARDLFQTPGFGETIDFDQIKQHYYVVHTDINPTSIVPQGPDPDVLARRRTDAAERTPPRRGDGSPYAGSGGGGASSARSASG